MQKLLLALQMPATPAKRRAEPAGQRSQSAAKGAPRGFCATVMTGGVMTGGVPASTRDGERDRCERVLEAARCSGVS